NLGGEVTGSQSATTVANAVSTNVANAIVRRDASGKFSAGSITATSLGIGTTPTALLHVVGTQPPPVGGPGTNATNVLTIHGGKGGDSTALGARAGMGGGVVIQGGDGGTASTVAFSNRSEERRVGKECRSRGARS